MAGESTIATRDPRPEAQMRGVFPITFQVALTGIETENDEVTIPNDADYLIRFATHDVRDTAALQTIIANPAILIALSFNTSGGQLQNVALPIGSLAAPNMALVKEWAAPLLVVKGQTLTAAFSNLVAFNYTARLTLHGFKVK